MTYAYGKVFVDIIVQGKHTYHVEDKEVINNKLSLKIINVGKTVRAKDISETLVPL